MKNVVRYTVENCSYGLGLTRGTVELTDGRELEVENSVVVDLETYEEFVEWRKKYITNEIDNINEQIQELKNKASKLQDEYIRLAINK